MPTPNAVYAACRTSNEVSVMNLGSNVVTTNIPVGNRPQALAITPDLTKVFVTNVNDGTVSVISTASNTVVATVTVGTSPVDVAIDGNGTIAYVANSGSASITPITVATNTAGAPIALPAGFGPLCLAVMPDNSGLYVAGAIAGTPQAYHVSIPGHVVGSAITPLDAQPTRVAIRPDGARVYISCGTGGSVRVISTASNTVVATWSIPAQQPQSVTISPDGTRGWVSGGSGDVYVWSTASDTQLHDIAVTPGDVLEWGTFNPTGSVFYVADLTGPFITRISASTFAVLGNNTGPLGNQAWGIALGPYPVAPSITIPPLFIPRKGLPELGPDDLNTDFLAIENWAALIGGPTLSLRQSIVRLSAADVMSNWIGLEVWSAMLVAFTAQHGRPARPPLFIPRKDSEGPADLTINFLAIQNWAATL